MTVTAGECLNAALMAVAGPANKPLTCLTVSGGGGGGGGCCVF